MKERAKYHTTPIKHLNYYNEINSLCLYMQAYNPRIFKTVIMSNLKFENRFAAANDVIIKRTRVNSRKVASNKTE